MRSNFSFSILLKGASTCSLVSWGFEPATFRLPDSTTCSTSWATAARQYIILSFHVLFSNLANSTVWAQSDLRYLPFSDDQWSIISVPRERKAHKRRWWPDLSWWKPGTQVASIPHEAFCPTACSSGNTCLHPPRRNMTTSSLPLLCFLCCLIILSCH